MLVTKIQRFSTQDGPGIRTTVFIQGCPLRCAWCHNPETQSRNAVLVWAPQNCLGCGMCIAACPHGSRRIQEETLIYDRAHCVSCGMCSKVCLGGACEMSSTDIPPEDILDILLRDRDFYIPDGGVTLSGGEPLWKDTGLDLLRKCRDSGLHTAVETAGAVPPAHMREAAQLADLLLYDIKDTNADRHRRMTGADNRLILENLRLAASVTHGRIRLRCIMVRTVNMEPSHYEGIAGLYHELACPEHCPSGLIEGVELLPYHAYAGSKACSVGMPDNGHREWIPEEADLQAARAYLTNAGVPVL